jgi:acyl carrier protein
MMTNAEIYKTAFAEGLELPEAAICDTLTRSETPDWDSVAQMRIVTELEDKFGIFFDTEDILSFDSYSAGIKILANHGITID